MINTDKKVITNIIKDIKNNPGEGVAHELIFILTNINYNLDTISRELLKTGLSYFQLERILSVFDKEDFKSDFIELGRRKIQFKINVIKNTMLNIKGSNRGKNDLSKNVEYYFGESFVKILNSLNLKLEYSNGEFKLINKSNGNVFEFYNLKKDIENLSIDLFSIGKKMLRGIRETLLISLKKGDYEEKSDEIKNRLEEINLYLLSDFGNYYRRGDKVFIDLYDDGEHISGTGELEYPSNVNYPGFDFEIKIDNGEKGQLIFIHETDILYKI